LLFDFQIFEYAQLADQTIAFFQGRIAQRFLFSPVGFVQLFAPGHDARFARTALAHAAFVAEMWMGKFANTGQHDKVAVSRNVALMSLPIAVDCDFWHRR
jgi:hypothetical protein